MMLFYSNNIVDPNLIIISEDDHVHCTKSLRLKKGDKIQITNGKGEVFYATIDKIERSQTTCIIDEVVNFKMIPHYRSIAIAPTKNIARLEWFVEKAVEIGIDTIFVFMSKRTERKAVNIKRIDKIMISALKQSGRYLLPGLVFCKDIKDLIDQSKGFDQKLIAHLEEGTIDIRNALKPDQNTLLLIGPEGDFSLEEISTCTNNNFVSVSLGNARLRTETAALVGLVIMRTFNDN